MGVRVVPEIEMPGCGIHLSVLTSGFRPGLIAFVSLSRHMSAYGLGLPELNLTIDTGNHHGVAAYGVANLASSHLIPTLSTILREAASMFDDELFFLGGDETDCPYNECDYGYYKNQTERCPHMATERTNWTCPPSGWMLNPEVSAWAKSQVNSPCVVFRCGVDPLIVRPSRCQGIQLGTWQTTPNYSRTLRIKSSRFWWLQESGQRGGMIGVWKALQ